MCPARTRRPSDCLGMLCSRSECFETRCCAPMLGRLAPGGRRSIIFSLLARRVEKSPVAMGLARSLTPSRRPTHGPLRWGSMCKLKSSHVQVGPWECSTPTAHTQWRRSSRQRRRVSARSITGSFAAGRHAVITIAGEAIVPSRLPSVVQA